jgi:outer membrane protein assembly factor BamB
MITRVLVLAAAVISIPLVPRAVGPPEGGHYPDLARLKPGATGSGPAETGHYPDLARLKPGATGSGPTETGHDRPGPNPDETWPGFRGHDMSGIAGNAKLPDRWSATDNVKWAVPVAGHGWSSPIVWGDRVFVTSAISSKPFKQPTPGLYGNDYIAELSAQGLSSQEIMKRVQARDNELSEEAADIKYMVYALDARTGKVMWEQEASRRVPFGGRHRKNTYASETPFTDGERLYASFGQNVGLFCYTLDGKPLWKKEWTPSRIYLDFGTASSPIVYDGRVYLLHDNEQQSSILALDARTGAEVWRTPRPSTGFPKSSWTTPFIWTHAQRTELVTTGHGLVLAYDLKGVELWRVGGMSMPTASPLAADGWLYVGTGSQGDANRPFLAIRPGAAGDISLKPGTTSNDFIAWSHPRASGYTPSALVRNGRAYLVHDTGILTVLDAKTGIQIYKVRVGGGGHTFSASPLAAGNRVLLLTEDGLTFVLEGGAEYKEIAKNDLAEMSLASPAIAGDALYVRTESKLYKIAQ